MCVVAVCAEHNAERKAERNGEKERKIKSSTQLQQTKQRVMNAKILELIKPTKI